MTFIEWGPFHDKRRNLDFKKEIVQLYRHEVMIAFIEDVLFHDQRMNLTIYEKISDDFIGIES
jgi:hypothetical protein